MSAVMMCIPVLNVLAFGGTVLNLVITELKKRLKGKRGKMKKERAKIPEERYVAHHISFYSDSRLIGKEIIHDKANANLKRRIRMLVRIKAPGYKICNHLEAPRKNSVSYTIQQEEIKWKKKLDFGEKTT